MGREQGELAEKGLGLRAGQRGKERVGITAEWEKQGSRESGREREPCQVSGGICLL